MVFIRVKCGFLSSNISFFSILKKKNYEIFYSELPCIRSDIAKYSEIWVSFRQNVSSLNFRQKSFVLTPETRLQANIANSNEQISIKCNFLAKKGNLSFGQNVRNENLSQQALGTFCRAYEPKLQSFRKKLMNDFRETERRTYEILRGLETSWRPKNTNY